MKLTFPAGKAFAFTILDDTDDATVANVGPIYDLLVELGLRTTKTVWALSCPPEEQGPFFAAQTLDDPSYLAFIQDLASRGFELAFHNATMGSSERERTSRALEVLFSTFGRYPRIHCNHGGNRENLYWGAARYLTPPIHTGVTMVRRALKAPKFEGELSDSPFFWGDICRERFDYVRAFAFARLNTARVPPGRPYREPRTPWVKRWFNTSDAPDVRAFNRLVRPDTLDQLQREGGYCILSTHLGKGFTSSGRVDPDVEKSLRYLADMPGWYVPVSQLLDHLLKQRGDNPITAVPRLAMEVDHILDRVRSRRSR